MNFRLSAILAIIRCKGTWEIRIFFLAGYISIHLDGRVWLLGRKQNKEKQPAVSVTGLNNPKYYLYGDFHLS